MSLDPLHALKKLLFIHKKIGLIIFQDLLYLFLIGKIMPYYLAAVPGVQQKEKICRFEYLSTAFCPLINFL